LFQTSGFPNKAKLFVMCIHDATAMVSRTPAAGSDAEANEEDLIVICA
jgi:hypothetical protein